MPQIFNLRGENVQTIAELRVDLIMSQDAQIKIIEVDNTSNVIFITLKGSLQEVEQLKQKI